MRHVSPALAELTAQAQTLTSAGDLLGARAVLAHVLDPIDVADPQRATADLAVAAALHARILIALGDPHSARLWAAFAHAAEDRLHGPHDERTLAAAVTHAAVLHRVGNHGRAAHVYHDLVLELINLDGPDSQRVLAAQADLATAEHSAGNCTAARARLTEAWTRHRRLYGDAAPSGIKMLARLGAMERECGRVSDAQHHLALAEELCGRYLPGDHPLRQQVTALAQAPASSRHHCGRVEQSTGPRGPGSSAALLDPGMAPATSAVPLSAPGDLTGRHARAGVPRPLPGQGSPDRDAPEPLIWPPDGQRESAPSPAGAAEVAPPADSVVPTPLSGSPGAGRPARPSTVKPPPVDPPVFVPLPPADPPAFGPPPSADPRALAGAVRPAEGHPRQGPPPSADPPVMVPLPPEPPGATAPPPGHGAAYPVAALTPPLPPEPPGPLAPPGHGAADPVAFTPPLKPAPAEPLSPPAEPRLASSPAPGVIHLAPTSQPHTAPSPPGPDSATGRIYTAGTRAVPAYPAQPAGPAEGVIRTGPVGWRPPPSSPAAAAMMSVPHPEVVRHRPAPGDDRLVPVLVERPEKRGSWQPLWLIGVIVAGILVAAGAVAATLPRGDDEAAIPGPAPSVAISSAPPPSASASPTGAAPEDLKLKDNRDSVSLTWSYPEDAEGPVLISGGRAGQEQRAFQQLPAGTTDYVVYGLNNAQDYCFAVAVVYDTDHVATSKPICTNRR